MAVKLHRCGGTWVKIDAHPCWKVQKALDESGIELRDGTVVRRESKELAEMIRAGHLQQGSAAAPESAPATESAQ